MTTQDRPEESRLARAIRRHRALLRPSTWREADIQLYRELGLNDGELGIIPHPPQDALAEQQEYFDSPY